MSRSIRTSILIAAPRARVWSVLMDFPSYPDWNPFIRSIKGKAEPGQQLEIIIEPPGGKAQTFRPLVLAADPERHFKWRGSLPVPRLFTGEHEFELSDEASGTRFDHGEIFSGLLVPWMNAVLAAVERGFLAMNEKLKVRTEEAARISSPRSSK
jgi:hypothetical protein